MLHSLCISLSINNLRVWLVSIVRQNGANLGRCRRAQAALFSPLVEVKCGFADLARLRGHRGWGIGERVVLKGQQQFSMAKMAGKRHIRGLIAA